MNPFSWNLVHLKAAWDDVPFQRWNIGVPFQVQRHEFFLAVKMEEHGISEETWKQGILPRCPDLFLRVWAYLGTGNLCFLKCLALEVWI